MLKMFVGYKHTFVDPIEKFEGSETMTSLTRLQRCYLSSDSGINNKESSNAYRTCLRSIAENFTGETLPRRRLTSSKFLVYRQFFMCDKNLFT